MVNDAQKSPARSRTCGTTEKWSLARSRALAGAGPLPGASPLASPLPGAGTVQPQKSISPESLMGTSLGALLINTNHQCAF